MFVYICCENGYAIKVLLEAQKKASKSALDIIVEQFNARIKKAEETISDLTKSMEFSQAEVKDLQYQVRDLLKSDRENRYKIVILMQRIDEVEQRANYQEDYNRRCNLRI